MVMIMEFTKIDYLFFILAGILFIVVMGSLALNLLGYMCLIALQGILRRLV